MGMPSPADHFVLGTLSRELSEFDVGEGFVLPNWTAFPKLVARLPFSHLWEKVASQKRAG